MSSAYVDIALDVLIAKANELGWSHVVDPPELAQKTFRPAKLLKMDGYGAAQDDAYRDYRRGLFIDEYAVIAGWLGSDPIEAAQVLAFHFAHAARSRTWLDGGRQENLYLLLIGPAGAHLERDWIDFAYTTERDEQICRKLVWLPSSSNDELRASFEMFCCRMFVARPWSKAGLQGELDPLRAVAKRFGEQLPSAWLDILEMGSSPGAQMAEQLIKALTNGAED